MSPISNALLTAVKANTRKCYRTWRITTKGGAAEMGISIFSDIDRYTLEDANWFYPVSAKHIIEFFEI